MAELVAQMDGCRFSARGALTTPAQIRKSKEYLRRAITLQQQGQGYTFVELLSACPSTYKVPLIKCGSFRRKTCSQSSIRAFSRTSKGRTAMEKTFFISGIGGQGVQVLCKALATVVDECGMNMCLFPWYQGQRRGGATFGRLIISDERVGAPEKRHYDVCVYLDPASLRDYADKRRKGGLVIVNSDLMELPDFDDVTVVSAPFSSMAESAGNERSFNLVVGGFLAAYTKIVPEEKLRRALLKKRQETNSRRSCTVVPLIWAWSWRNRIAGTGNREASICWTSCSNHRASRSSA